MIGVLDTLRERLAAALAAAVRAGELQVSLPQPVQVEVPADPGHGEVASNLALALAREARKSPRQVAEILAGRLDLAGTPATRVEVAGPGFLNFHFGPEWPGRVVREVLAAGPGYGRSTVGAGQKVQVEFVSANPTGPMNVVNARAAAVGDTLASLLSAAGYQVVREYYVNDAGTQADRFAASLEARILQETGRPVPFPEDGYPGEYVRELARELLAARPDLPDLAPEARRAWLAREGPDRMVEAQRRELGRFGVHYDVWFRERDLHESGFVSDTLEQLRSRGALYEAEGAVWFRSTRWGDEKDRVLVRANGTPTYFAADIAYHRNKRERGFDLVIDVLGPDHHGHIQRFRSAWAALGYPPEGLEFIMLQVVRLLRNGEPVRMSKRAGEFVTLDELADEVGVDAARFFLLMRAPSTPLDFDLGLAREQSAENPVYYVQYAHARICSILRQAAAEGVPRPDPGAVDCSVLTAEPERALVRQLAMYPLELELARSRREPQRLPHFLHELAGHFHLFYTRCRVLGERPPLRDARLLLVEASRTVLASGLSLMGVRAPERM